MQWLLSQAEEPEKPPEKAEEPAPKKAATRLQRMNAILEIDSFPETLVDGADAAAEGEEAGEEGECV